jgi:hypothetical protein
MGIHPHGVDWNDDGKVDLIAGDCNGNVWFFRNTGTCHEPELDRGVKVKAGKSDIGYTNVLEDLFGSTRLRARKAKVSVTDWNKDGLHDLIITHVRGQSLLYLNTGKRGQPVFNAPEVIKPSQGPFPLLPSTCVVDWNLDGKPDLLMGDQTGTVYFYPNVGSEAKPCFTSGQPLRSEGRTLRVKKKACISTTDWNNDGKPDLLLGNHRLTYARGAKGKAVSNSHIWLFLQK